MDLRESGVSVAAATVTKASMESASKSTPTATGIGASVIGCYVFEKMLSLYRWLKDYLNHFGVLLTAIVVILACSLKGKLNSYNNNSQLQSWEGGKRDGSSSSISASHDCILQQCYFHTVMYYRGYTGFHTFYDDAVPADVIKINNKHLLSVTMWLVWLCLLIKLL